MTKPREKTREELTAEIEDSKKKIQQYENREKILRQKLSREERRERNHRLIVRGAVFESIVPEAKTMTDEEAAALLTLTQSQKRIAELDVIIMRLYEDNISGKLSDERFIKLSRDYELEQTNLTNLVEHLRQEVKEQEKQKVNVRQFIAAVRKYTDMQQLDASVLREFVEKIYISEVYTPDENEPRIKVREIEIVYNFIGAFDFEEAREQSQAAQKEKKTGVA